MHIRIPSAFCDKYFFGLAHLRGAKADRISSLFLFSSTEQDDKLKSMKNKVIDVKKY
jgi:hypothetical protein